MKPNEIRSQLVLHQVTGAEIARLVGCSKQYVSLIIKRTRTNAEIELIIAKAIDKPVDEVFPPATNQEKAA